MTKFTATEHRFQKNSYSLIQPNMYKKPFQLLSFFVVIILESSATHVKQQSEPPPGRLILPSMTEAVKCTFAERHNLVRQAVSLGKCRALPPAKTAIKPLVGIESCFLHINLPYLCTKGRQMNLYVHFSGILRKNYILCILLSWKF